MKPNFLQYLLCNAVLGILILLTSGCNDKKVATGEFGYLLSGADKDRQAVVDRETGVVYPMTFHEESDKEMLSALKNLRVGILYPQANGKSIFLLGELDAVAKTFKLNSWFITTPYYEIVLGEGKSRTIQRRRLVKKDFYTPPDLNLEGLVMDSRVHEAQRWGGVGLPYSNRDFGE